MTARAERVNDGIEIASLGNWRRSAPDQVYDQGEDKQDDENDQEDPSQVSREYGDPAEAEESRDEREQEKEDGPTQHNKGTLHPGRGSRSHRNAWYLPDVSVDASSIAERSPILNNSRSSARASIRGHRGYATLSPWAISRPSAAAPAARRCVGLRSRRRRRPSWRSPSPAARR